MAVHPLVAAHATLQHMGDAIVGDAGAVVLDGDRQTRAATRHRVALGHGQQHLRTRPLERVLQQVAEQLLQVAGFTVETRLGGDLEFAQHALGGVDLLQAGHDLLGLRFDLDRRGEQLVAGARGAGQLVADQVVHPPQLGFHLIAQLGLIGTAVQARAQDRERRLQAMRQVSQRVALAIQVLALALDKGVDAVGQRFQLARVRLAHSGGLAVLDALEFGDDIAQRAQAPAQHQHLQQQQDHTGAAQVTPQRRAERRHLPAECSRVFEDVDGVGEFAARILAAGPQQAITVAIHLARAAVDAGQRQRPLENSLAGVEHYPFRQPWTLRGIGLPVSRGQHDLRVQAAPRSLETGIRHIERWDKTAVAREVAGRVCHCIAVQPLAHAALGGALEGAIQRITGQCEEGDQAQAGRPQLPRLQRPRLGDAQPTQARRPAGARALNRRLGRDHPVGSRGKLSRRCARWRSGNRGRGRFR